jgi:Tfp pilus assembly protein PilV
MRSWVGPLDSTSPATETVELQPAEAYSPPPSAMAPSSSRSSFYVPRERRLWTAALAAALLLSVGGLGILYVDDTNYQNAARALTTQTEQLTGRNQILQTQLTTTQNQLTASQGQVTSLTAELAHPTLGIWNVPQTISGSSNYLAAGVPDTFTYHLKLTSSGAVSVSILSIKQFGDAVTCVKNGVANTNYCMHHSGSAWGQLSTTSVNYDFHLAEGCAAYLAVITSTGTVTVTPDVSVTYNPASAATGACA